MSVDDKEWRVLLREIANRNVVPALLTSCCVA
jgi:hypothetical protein